MKDMRARLSHQEGFTLIELLIVIVIIGILLAIAVPSYLGFKDRANKRAVQSDIREAIPTAEAFYSDHGSYTNLALPSMTQIDSGISQNLQVAVLNGGQNYCIGESKGNQSWAVKGPGATWSKGATNCSGSVTSVNG